MDGNDVDDDFALTLGLDDVDDADDVKAASLGALDGIRKAGLDAVVVAVFVVLLLLLLVDLVLMSAVPPTISWSRSCPRRGPLNATAAVVVFVVSAGARKA
jgi:hypothetical protein